MATRRISIRVALSRISWAASGADGQFPLIPGDHPRVHIGAARHRRGVAQLLGHLFHHRRLDPPGDPPRHRGIGLGERRRRQHHAVPGAQVLDRVLVADQLLEPVVEVVGAHLRPSGCGAAHQQPVAAVPPSHQRTHRPDHFAILDPHGAPDPALGREVELHRVTPDRHVLAQQGGQPVGLVLLGVLLAAGTEVAAIEQPQPQRQHPLAGQTPGGQVLGDSGPPGRQLGGQLQHPVELLLRAFLLPRAVVQVLAATGRVDADGLDVAVGVGRDPHFLPRRRNDQILDALQGFGIAHRGAVRRVIRESLTAPFAGDPRFAQHAATEPHSEPSSFLGCPQRPAATQLRAGAIRLRYPPEKSFTPRRRPQANAKTTRHGVVAGRLRWRQPAMNSWYADSRYGGSAVTLHCRSVSPIGARMPRRSLYSCG